MYEHAIHFFCKARTLLSDLHRDSFQISLKHLLIIFLHKGFRMRFFFCSLLMATVPVLTLAMDQSPQNSKSPHIGAILTSVVHRLSTGSQLSREDQPLLNRQVSPPIAIPALRHQEQHLSNSYSTNSSTSSLSSSPASSNGTPGTSPESDSAYRYLYYPYPGAKNVEYRDYR